MKDKEEKVQYKSIKELDERFDMVIEHYAKKRKGYYATLNPFNLFICLFKMLAERQIFLYHLFTLIAIVLFPLLYLLMATYDIYQLIYLHFDEKKLNRNYDRIIKEQGLT